MSNPYVYWSVFAVACLICAAVPYALVRDHLREMRRLRDQERWNRRHRTDLHRVDPGNEESAVRVLRGRRRV